MYECMNDDKSNRKQQTVKVTKQKMIMKIEPRDIGLIDLPAMTFTPSPNANRLISLMPEPVHFDCQNRQIGNSENERRITGQSEQNQ